jgi:hypothetical protein
MKDINWIECNLPWKNYDYIPKEVSDAIVQFPEEELNALAKEKFSTTVDEIEENDFMIRGDVRTKVSNLRSLYEEKDDYELLELTKDEDIIQYLKLKILKAEIFAWEITTPQYKKYHHELMLAREKDKKERPKKSFYPNLAKSGVLIELESGKQLLIGDINESGGTCDDCLGIGDDEVIKRYAVIIELGQQHD